MECNFQPYVTSLLLLCVSSGAEALSPAWNERYGVHQSNPHPEDQGGPGLRTEGSDQRTGTVLFNSINDSNVSIPSLFVPLLLYCSVCSLPHFLHIEATQSLHIVSLT